jgi:uncharacterized integral membrane protein
VNQPDTTPPGHEPTGAGVPTASDSPEPTPDPTENPKGHAGLTGKGRVRPTRVSALYVGLVVAAILAIFLLIFIIQNSSSVTIQFLGFEGQISLAIALLLAAVVGILVVAVPGSLRILQLGRALRKNAKD